MSYLYILSLSCAPTIYFVLNLTIESPYLSSTSLDLYELFKIYIREGNRILINIPFPEINRRIKGLLSTSINEGVWIKLEKEKF